MSAQPAISVIVPTHNVGPWVRECLASILDDQDVDFELVVVDDHSTDDTWQIVSDLAAADPRIRPVRSIGTGGAQARNLGVELARGEYLVFCDGDDLVPRGAYGHLLASARATGADMVIGNFLKFWSTRTWRPTLKWPAFDERRTGVTLPEAPSLIRNRACWNRMFRRDFWLNEHIYFPSVPRSNDIVPMTKALVGAKHIDVITEDVYIYRGRPGDGSMSSRAASLESYASYLSQEYECSALVATLGDADLRAEYDDLFLSADGWVHLRGFLSGMPQADYEKDELDRLGKLLTAQLDSLDEASFARLTLDRRLVYALSAAGAWGAASRLIRAIKPASEPMPDGMWFLEQIAALQPSPMLPTQLFGKALTRWLIPSLVDGSEAASAETVTILTSHRDLFRRVYSDDVAVRGLPVGGQQLVRALEVGREDAIRERLKDGLLNVTPELITIRNGMLVVRAAVSGPKVDNLELYAACADSRRRLRCRVTADGQRREASLPIFLLSRGEWSIRVVARDEVGPLDAEIVIPSVAVQKRGRRWGRVVIHSRSGERRGESVVVRGQVVQRAARRIVRAILRRVRRRLPGSPMVG